MGEWESGESVKVYEWVSVSLECVKQRSHCGPLSIICLFYCTLLYTVHIKQLQCRTYNISGDVVAHVRLRNKVTNWREMRCLESVDALVHYAVQ